MVIPISTVRTDTIHHDLNSGLVSKSPLRRLTEGLALAGMRPPITPQLLLYRPDREVVDLNGKRVPANGVILSAVIAALITLPALAAVDVNGAPVPVAFFAVVSIGVVGLYLAFAVPIYYRWKAGAKFKVGSWNLRGHHKWLAPIALIEIIVTSIIALFPTSLGGMPWDPSFEWKFVNYTPLLVGGVLIVLWIYWHVSVKKWFTGPIKQVEVPASEPEPA